MPPAVRRALRGVAEDVAVWRRLKGLTQVQLADRANVSRDTLARLEGGDGGVSTENLLRILRGLGILDGLEAALDPYASDIGRMRSEERLPQRVRPRRLGGPTMSEVDVVIQIEGEDRLAGRLWSHRRRGRESATFSYAPEYLSGPDSYALDPALPLVAGPQQTPLGRAIFGAFSDCAPDRWGRRLIERDRAPARRSRGHGCAELW